MISPQRVSKVTVIALATGAIAAPVASAYPPGTGPGQSSIPATQPVNPSKPVAYIARASGQPTGAVTTSPSRKPGGPVYSRQDKQLSPSTQSPPMAWQGVPPILPAPNASQSAAIRRAEQQAAQGLRYTLPNSAVYSNAETNAYPTRSGTVRLSATDGAFDWGDAGIGAAGGLMLTIVAIGGGLALVQRRTRRTGTTAVSTG